MIKSFRNIYILFLLVLLTFASLCSHSNNTNSFIIDILSHFPLQYTVIAITFAIFFLLTRRIFFLFLSFLIVVINISGANISNAIVNFNSVEASCGEAVDFKVYSANVNKDNEDLSFLIREIERLDPEILFLTEVGDRQLRQLSRVIARYEYKVIDPRITRIGGPGIGIVLLSKFRVIERKLTPLSKNGNAIFEGVINTTEGNFLFYGVHFPRLNLKSSFSIRQKEIIAFALLISDTSMPFIIAGDFNTTPYSPIFRRFLKISGLTYEGRLLSWPVYFPPLWIPIDHILTSEEIQIINRMTGSYIGSDHYPVIAELLINK